MAGHVPTAPVSEVAASIINSDDESFLKMFPGLKDAIDKVPDFPEIEAEADEEIVAMKQKIAEEDGEDKEEAEAEEEVKEDGAKVEEEDAEEEEKEDTSKAEDKPKEKEEKKPLITDFQVFDEEGELEAESLSNLKVTFKADNEVQENVPFDKVVRLAKFGKYNERLVREADESKAARLRVEEEAAEVRRQADALRDYARKLLENDEFLGEQRTEFEKANTPEEQLKRVRAEKVAFEQQKENERFAEAAQGFVLKLDGKLGVLQKQYGEHISEDEVRGRIDRLTLPLKRAGVIPREQWASVERLIDEDLATWMASVHEERAGRSTATRKEVEKVTEKAKKEVRETKRAFARAIKPPAAASRKSTDPLTPSKRKQPSTREEAENNILSDVLRFVRK